MITGPRNTGGVSLEAAPLVRALAASAYRAGASLVEVTWGDEAILLDRFAHAPRGSFAEVSDLSAGELLRALVRAVNALRQPDGSVVEAIQTPEQRVVFGKPLSKFQVNQFKFVDMLIKIQAARELAYACVRRRMSGQDATREISMAKIFCIEAQQFVATTCLQLFGGAADDQYAYFGVSSVGVVALNLANGELKWTAPIKAAGPRLGVGAALSVIPGAVFIPRG